MSACPKTSPHGPHEWISGALRDDCPGVLATDLVRQPVIHLDAETLTPIGVSKPCSATAVAHLGTASPGGARVPCGLLADGHERHVFHIEWTDPAPAPPSEQGAKTAAERPMRRPQ